MSVKTHRSVGQAGAQVKHWPGFHTKHQNTKKQRLNHTLEWMNYVASEFYVSKNTNQMHSGPDKYKQTEREGGSWAGMRKAGCDFRQVARGEP